MQSFFRSAIILCMMFDLVTTGYGQPHDYRDALMYEIGVASEPVMRVDTINRGNKLDVTFIGEREMRYLVLTNGDSINSFKDDTSYWYRKVSFENFHGRNAIVVRQDRYYADTMKNSHIITVMDTRDLASLYSYKRDNRNEIEAYDFHENVIYGTDSIQGNIKKGGTFQGGISNYLFETDFEILGSLPVQSVGQIFAVEFFSDPVGKHAGYYLVSVVGKDDFKISDNLYACCWKLKLEYDQERYDYLWISMKNHVVLKKESHIAKIKNITMEYRR